MSIDKDGDCGTFSKRITSFFNNFRANVFQKRKPSRIFERIIIKAFSILTQRVSDQSKAENTLKYSSKNHNMSSFTKSFESKEVQKG